MTKANPSVISFITGASRGIGYEISRHVAPMCSHLIITSKTKANIDAAVKKLSGETKCSIHPFWGDIAKGRSFANKAREYVASIADRIDLLVLNAGYYVDGALAEIGDADFERNMQVNCFSAHYLVSSLLPLLRKSDRARIVIIGSTAAYESYPLVPTYGIAKWGLRGYAINLRKELMSEDIGVTFIAPGGTLTDMWKGVELPKNRLLEPADIGKLVATMMTLSAQAVVEELIVRPMLGDIHE
jgi:short-subunit dehydrogenase